MAFSNIAEYSSKARRELLWDKWDSVRPPAADGAVATATQDQVTVPAELAAKIDAVKESAITEWTPDVQDDSSDSLQSCGGGGCGCW